MTGVNVTTMPEHIREQHFKVIEEQLKMPKVGELMAREYDKRFNLGYFKEKESPENYWLDQFITVNADMLALKLKVKKLAALEIEDSVTIIGESGTGKELLAKALHGKRKGEVVELNCAGLPEHLMESELFGHVRGAFTGADSEKEGLFALADKGTLFLDEIGELPLQVQAKLLRVLQDKRIRKVGGKKYIAINVRFVAATHIDLDEAVKINEFRLDLWHRLNTFVLRTIPLKDRPEDIIPILKSLDAPEELIKNSSVWSRHLTGNVRALQSIVKRYKVLGELPV